MKIAVIGAGPGGIATGYELLQRGFSDFTIFDEQDAPGGTWRQHSYPGLACDVWAHSYTFSYAPNPDWSASFVGYAEIQRYLADCVTRFGLKPHMALNTRIDRAQWLPSGRWALSSASGPLGEFDVVVSAMGNQHTPLYPDVPGRDEFAGDSWHSTEWNHDVDISGKRVVVVGSAAAAVQIVPEIAQQAGHLTILQRSANWIMPRRRKLYSDKQRDRYRRFPWLMKLIRRVQGLMMGQVEHAVTIGHNRMGQFENMVRKYIDETVEDPALREALMPDSRYGCKRGLVSDGFYQSLNRDNVQLVPQGLARVTPSGVETADGTQIDADVIVYCTGYKILDYDRFEVIGRDGANLQEFMADGQRAHKGICAPGFPNYFFAIGPNGLVLNVSYFITAERNVETIVRLVGECAAAGRQSLEVKEGAFADYNAWMDEQFARFSWGASDCKSYYQDASGHAPFLFPGNFKQWRDLHEQMSLQEFSLG